MKLIKKAGATSEIWQIFVADSSSTTGGGLTGLVFNTASLTAYYHRDTDTTATAITLVTMTVGTFTSSGFKEIDATNMPGWYQFCPPNAAIAASAKSCAFHLKGATNMAPLPIEVQLTTVDVDDATAFGLSRLDAAITSRMATYTQPTGFLAATFPGTVASTTNITSATGITVATNSDKTGYTLSSAGVQAIWDALTSALTTVGSIGKLIVTNLDALISSRMATYSQPTGFLAATFPTGTIANTTNITGGVITTVTNLTNAPTAGDLTATMKTSVTTAATAATPIAASVTGAVGSVTGNIGGTLANLAAGAKTDVENAVWNATMSSHIVALSTGAALNAAGSAGDPWITALPGAYGAGSAGAIIGNLPSATTIAAAVQTSAAASPLPADAKKMNGTTIIGTGTSGDLWRA